MAGYGASTLPSQSLRRTIVTMVTDGETEAQRTEQHCLPRQGRAGHVWGLCTSPFPKGLRAGGSSARQAARPPLILSA